MKPQSTARSTPKGAPCHNHLDKATSGPPVPCTNASMISGRKVMNPRDPYSGIHHLTHSVSQDEPHPSQVGWFVLSGGWLPSSTAILTLALALAYLCGYHLPTRQLVVSHP
eukprot:248073-Amphidinium_carterae.1